jgi:putative spermidine/putrescine transport system ATP-binding protein
MENVPPHKRNIGMVFQRYTLFPHMTALENVAFPLKARNVGKADRLDKARAALQLVRLDQFADRMPSQLSGGQQQRVAIARALVYQPEILLMDEPLGALDRKLREEIQDEIRTIHNRLGVTVIYVTHDQEEALRMSDRIAVMNHGEIVQIGTGEDLYEDPNSLFIAQFLGSSNVLPGRMSGISEGTAVFEIAGHPVRGRLPGKTLSKGDSGLAMFRPERAHLAAADLKGEGLNSLPVTIQERLFLGETVTTTAETSDGTRVVVRDVKLSQSSPAFSAGDQCHLVWPVSETRFFPVEGRP